MEADTSFGFTFLLIVGALSAWLSGILAFAVGKSDHYPVGSRLNKGGSGDGSSSNGGGSRAASSSNQPRTNKNDGLKGL